MIGRYKIQDTRYKILRLNITARTDINGEVLAGQNKNQKLRWLYQNLI